MSHYYPDSEAPSERLLFVSHSAPDYSSDYMYIDACVVRRAMQHTFKADDGSIDQYWDERDEANCLGYRNASWSSPSKTQAIYVSGLRLHGQMDRWDRKEKPLQFGMPYCNKPMFDSPNRVEHREARLMHQAFDKMVRVEKRIQEADLKANRPVEYNDTFFMQLVKLARILGIRNFVFNNLGAVRSGWLSKPDQFHECTFNTLQDEVNCCIIEAHGGRDVPTMYYDDQIMKQQEWEADRLARAATNRIATEQL